jgi:hypothetical protein
MNKIKTSYKIAVTPELSKEIQKICFKNGIIWSYCGDTVSHINSKYLYIDIDDMLIREGSDCELFDTNNKEKINAEDFIKKYGSGSTPINVDRDIPKNRTICKTVYKQGLNDFNNEMQKIYDNYNNHDIDVKYCVTSQQSSSYFSAFVTITPKQTKENLKIG